MVEKKKNPFFKYNDCDLCGQCLERCEYMDLGHEQAVDEIGRLVRGEPAPIVADKCTSCYACNTFCPNDCHPYELIIGSWNERYKKNGLPVRVSYLMPDSSPNFRTDIVDKLGPRDRHLHDKWTKTQPEGPYVIYPGCNALVLPHLLDLDFLRDIPVSGDFHLCCGEMYFRMGLFDVVERTAQRLTEYYRGRDIGTMLFVCPAGLNMFRNVLPKQFGAKFSFKTMYLGKYILDRIRQGSVKITTMLDRKVAVHDSCHGRLLHDEVTETARRLYSIMGLDVLEVEPNRQQGLCCGMAAGCNRYRPDDIYQACSMQLKRVHKTGAKELAVYCGGCQLLMSMMRWISPGTLPVRHLFEYICEATGNPIRLPASKRSLRMLTNVALKTLPRLLSQKTYRID